MINLFRDVSKKIWVRFLFAYKTKEQKNEKKSKKYKNRIYLINKLLLLLLFELDLYQKLLVFVGVDQ